MPPAWPDARFARADNRRRRASERGLPFTSPELAENHGRVQPASRPQVDDAAPAGDTARPSEHHVKIALVYPPTCDPTAPANALG